MTCKKKGELNNGQHPSAVFQSRREILSKTKLKKKLCFLLVESSKFHSFLLCCSLMVQECHQLLQCFACRLCRATKERLTQLNVKEKGEHVKCTAASAVSRIGREILSMVMLQKIVLLALIDWDIIYPIPKNSLILQSIHLSKRKTHILLPFICL